MKLNLFKRKPIIVCIHGFGIRRTHEFTELHAFLSKKGYICLMPELFDQTDMDDTNPAIWIQRAYDAIEAALSKNRKVIVIGFSMGGVIASSIAAKYPIEKLILLAPAFEYVTLRLVKDLVTSKVAKRWIKPMVQQGNYPPLPEHFNNTFTEVVALCKNSVANIQCPTLILHGSSDEVIPLRSSDYVYQNISSQYKKRIILSNVAHRLLDDPFYQSDCFQLILNHIQLTKKQLQI